MKRIKNVNKSFVKVNCENCGKTLHRIDRVNQRLICTLCYNTQPFIITIK
ncbi:MAG: hypothetical protein ACOCP8_08885 [archaeon]